MPETYKKFETNKREYISKETKLIKTGIVGAGLMGRWHANAAKQAGGVLSAIVDTSVQASKRLAKKYSCNKIFPSVEKMLEQIEIDVLHICSPLDTHAKIGKLAINAGINLIIEKPITPTFVEAKQLLDLAKSNDVLMCVVHQFLFQEGVLKAMNLLPNIGRLIHINSTISSAGAFGYSQNDYDLIAADILPHPLSLMEFFVPGGVSEKEWKMERIDYGEFRAFAKTSQTSLSIFISMNARPTECSFQIIGTKGTIHIDLFHGFAFVEKGKVSKTGKILQPFALSTNRFLSSGVNLTRRIFQRELAYPGLNKLVKLFYISVHTHCKSPVSYEDILAVAKVRDLLLHSAGIL